MSGFDATVTWYNRVFGFELVEEDLQDGTRWGVICQGDSMLCIYQFADGRFEDRSAGPTARPGVPSIRRVTKSKSH